MTRTVNPPNVDPLALDPFALGNVADPAAYYDVLRASAPVHRVQGTDFFLVSSWDLVAEATERTDDFSSNLRNVLVSEDGRPPAPVNMDLGGLVEQVLATADAPYHRAHRRHVTQSLTRRVLALEGAVDEITRQLWDEHVTSGSIDWVDVMGERLPLAMLSHLIGLPMADLPRLLELVYDSTELLGGIVAADRIPHLMDAALQLTVHLDKRFAEAREQPRDDLLGVLATAHAAGDLEIGTGVLILTQLVGAGAESTAALISTSAWILARDAELQSRLRADRSLIDPFLDECLRVESPFKGHYRHVVRDTELGGVPIPANSALFLMWGAANRDPVRYANPGVIDLEREAMRGHMGFGKGLHFCVGSTLARLEATAALNTLLDHTQSFSLDETGTTSWLPSIMVRRLQRLDLAWR